MKNVRILQNLGNVENLQTFGLSEAIAKQLAGRQITPEDQTVTLADDVAAALKAALPAALEIV